MNVEGERLSFAAMNHEPEEMSNAILAYKAVNPNILRLHEAMQAKDQKEFKAAMEKEVNDQIDNGNFYIIPQSKVPTGFRVFPGVWTLVHKRDILTQEIKKYKAHLAFFHRNLYGQKQAGRVWYEYLCKRMVTKAGFIQSKHDECLFYCGKVMYALHIDDSILGAPTCKELEAAIKAIQDAKLRITLKGDLADFLGVKIEQKSTNKIIFTQPHLIDDILNDLGLKHAKNGKETSAASSRILTRNDDRVDHDKSFHYQSVIGKLNYHEKATRPDISFATHQCARFAAAPKKSHTRVVRWLGCYQLHSRKKGMWFRAAITCGLEVFVDASLAGNWDKNDAQTGDHDTARSRHGYIILYYGCPLIWKSQLQTEIALSSTESEYTGLSYALREAIPLMSLLDESKEKGFPVDQTKATIQCNYSRTTVVQSKL